MADCGATYRMRFGELTAAVVPVEQKDNAAIVGDGVEQRARHDADGPRRRRPGGYAIGLANRLVGKGEARREAERLAHALAGLPQTAMLSDRSSLLSQRDFPEDEAIRREIDGSRPAMQQGFQSGAQRFVSGSGRHGEGVGRFGAG
jgi:hypothetical protein